MKNLYISLGFMFAFLTVAAQTKETAAADKLFKEFEYVDAAKEYLKLSRKKDPYVYKQLAESYFNVYNSKEAVKWYAKAVETPQDAETYYRFAQMLKAEGRYEESNAQMQKFASLAPKDQRAVAFNQDPDYLPKLKSQTRLFDEKILDINDDKYADFGAVLVNNTLYFTSARNTARKTYGRNEEPFLDMYTATHNSDGSFSNPTPIDEINSKFHDGPATVTADGNTMYFSSESFKEGNYEKDTPGQRTGLIYLFVATKSNGRWSNIKAVPFNGKTFSTGNPSISKDGKTLYFASNRKGSLGGTDIWKVEVKGDNKYSEPVNLGKKINTEGNENFPFIADDNKLYFASDGRKGIGAMDIYVADLTLGSDAMNLGLPVNSPQDDFSFTFNVEANKGFFASNRKGNDDIYLAIPICGVDAVVMVRDSKTGKPLSAASVAILDEKGNVIETRKTNTEGWVTYSVDCNTSYAIVASADGYENKNFPIAKNKGGKVEIPASLDPIENLIVDGKVQLKDIYFEFDKSNITQEAAYELNKLVQVMKTKPELVISVEAHTDNRGSDEYNMSLSDRRARATVQYVITQGIAKERISGKGFGESRPRIKCTECTDEQHAENRRTEFIIVNK